MGGRGGERTTERQAETETHGGARHKRETDEPAAGTGSARARGTPLAARALQCRTRFQSVPLKPGAPMATRGRLTSIGTWNESFWPLLVGQNEAVRVLTVGLGVFKSPSPQGAPDWSGLMAATLIAALPVLILFIAFGKRVVNSIGFSGIK